MNELTKTQSSQLLTKIQDDLTHGYKVKGNLNIPYDVVRVWCRLRTSEKHFMIVATSNKRFGDSGSLIELQSFGPGANHKLTFLVIEGNLLDVNISQTTQGDEFTFTDFLNLFFNSPADKDLTLFYFRRDGNNPNDLELLD